MTALFQAGEAEALAGRAFERRVDPSEPRPSRRRHREQTPPTVVVAPEG